MALSDDPKTTPLLLILLAGMVGYIGYTGALLDNVGMNGLQAQTARVEAVRDTIARLEAQTDSAKQELARGTAEDLRKRIEQDRQSLLLLRQLVPERSEVPNLLDDISTRAKIRGLNLAQVVPQAVEAGPAPFNTDRYQMQVIGRYDQVGQFLADIASLKRVIVPSDVSIGVANNAAAKALGDTSGALLEVKFQVRTYVKSAAQAAEEEDGSGT
ncbi:MAG TPA: type 4a pilus biogenesis protein PilO [Gemmatimonadales bacterium]|nr:type 4a pilus biogenesis protein PilO [Gemmatimonadales bacterium]